MATIMAPNALAKAAIEDRYLGILRDLLSTFAGEALALRVILNPIAQDQLTSEIAPPAESVPNSQLPTSVTPSPIVRNSELKTQNSELIS